MCPALALGRQRKGQAAKARAGNGVTGGSAGGDTMPHAHSEPPGEHQVLQGHSRRRSGNRTPLWHSPAMSLTPCWLLLQNNMALQENPKVAAARKEALSPACTCNPHHCSHPHHCSRHRLGQPCTVRGGCHLPASRREQKISSGTVVTGQDFSRISTSGAIAAAKPCESRLVMRAGLRDLEPGPCLAPVSQAFKRDSDFLRLKQP